jgi:hypothetical protein
MGLSVLTVCQHAFTKLVMLSQRTERRSAGGMDDGMTSGSSGGPKGAETLGRFGLSRDGVTVGPGQPGGRRKLDSSFDLVNDRSANHFGEEIKYTQTLL